jgi:hypothetical protein
VVQGAQVVLRFYRCRGSHPPVANIIPLTNGTITPYTNKRRLRSTS